MKTIGAIGLVLAISAGAAGTEPKKEPFDPSRHPEYFSAGGDPQRWEYFSAHDYQPSKTIRWTMRTREQIVWDVSVTTNEHADRVVHQDHLEQRGQFLAVFGCSFVYGTGLNDDQTLPYELAQRIKTHHVYNMGYRGSGPNLLLAHLQDKSFAKRLKETHGTLAYVAIAGHLGRVNGFLAESSWGRDDPYFDYAADGHLVRNGSFASAHPLKYKIYDWVWKLVAGKLGYAKFNWPPLMKSHFEYFCDVVNESKHEFEKQFPGSHFVVVNHPLVPLQDEVKSCLAERGIDVVNGDPELRMHTEMYIPLDGHPSATFNRVFAAELAKSLSVK